MSDFNNENKNETMGDDTQNGYNGYNNDAGQYGADHYSQNSNDQSEHQPDNDFNGTYYTPPQKPEEPENTTYHYSYVNQNKDGQNANASADQNTSYQSDYQPGSAYGQSQSAYQPADSSAQQNGDGKKKPKKSKAGIAILITIIVCVCVAIAGIIGANLLSGDKDTSDNSVTQSQDGEAGEVTTNDSEDVATVDGEGNYTVAGVAQKCMDSCVGITVYSQQASAYNYFYGYGYGYDDDSDSSEQTESGEGSGVIMSESNGKTYILTCAHVISDGDSFKVTLNDKTEYDAAMVAYDSQTDIGVLSIDATGLSVAEFADSSNLVVGEQVVAIGCPGGLEFMNSVTSGYISALDRPVSSSIGYDNNCIQTDAAINPGNSGGALFNMQGQVIGINSSKIASTEYEGMGFAVPSSTAVATANSLIKSGYVEGRAKLGIQYNPITSFNNSAAIINALSEKGFEDAEGTMVINSVDDESDLKNKDIRQYDMIVAVNGQTMTSTDVMTSILADSKPGDTITLTIARIENNEITTFEIDCTLIESKG